MNEHERQVHAKLDLIIGELKVAVQRVTVLEGRVGSIEDNGRPPPIDSMPPFRAPMPSLTNEERREMHQTNAQSIQVVGEGVKVVARATRLTPWITAAAIVVSAFVSGVVQSCQLTASNTHQTPTQTHQVPHE